MRINHDLSLPIIVRSSDLTWEPSPIAGVERLMLFRVGGEVARATSIVRYAPNSSFPRHAHPGGEEILVLEGTFQDEHGDYPAGTYLRNPPGTSHVPAPRGGCVIFVRLWQHHEGDLSQIVLRPGQGEWKRPREGAVSATILFDDGQEQVCLEDWREGAVITLDNLRGLEFLLISGSLVAGDRKLEPLSWGRFPAGQGLVASVGLGGARIWLKDSFLKHPLQLVMPE